MKHLVEANAHAIEQMCSTFRKLEDTLWSRPAVANSGLRIGAHVRHILDFYDCFFAGVNPGDINYDARGRNRDIESNRAVAMRALQSVINKLAALDDRICDRVVAVRDEQCVVNSTVEREMICLLNHTIHHMALIAVALHYFGVPADPSFGVAPSTLRYRERTGVAA